MRLQSLDGWRGLTALLVVLFHLDVSHTFFHHAWLRQLQPVLEFFFIVSGFVMAMGFRDKITDSRSFWAYLVRRLGRVWPLHLAMIGLLLLLQVARFLFGGQGDLFDSSVSRLDTLPEHVLMIQTWWPATALSWNFPSWTLSAEIVAYALMGLIVLASPNAWMRRVLALIIVAAAGIAFQQRLAESEVHNVVAISRCLFGFFLGFLLYDLWEARPVRTLLTANVLEVLGFAAFLLPMFTLLDGPAYFLYHAGYSLLIYVYASDKGLLSHVMSCKPLHWLGQRSFSIYMFHAVVLIWLQQLLEKVDASWDVPLRQWANTVPGERWWIAKFPEQWMNDAVALAYVATVLAGAWLIHRTIEEPSRVYFAKLACKLTFGSRQTKGRPMVAAE